MALQKTIQQPNGLVLDYHRIAMVKIDTNEQCTILVYSYLSEDARAQEKVCLANLAVDTILPYYAYEYMSFPYDESMSIKKAYEWLKKQPKFEGAEDV